MTIKATDITVDMTIYHAKHWLKPLTFRVLSVTIAPSKIYRGRTNVTLQTTMGPIVLDPTDEVEWVD